MFEFLKRLVGGGGAKGSLGDNILEDANKILEGKGTTRLRVDNAGSILTNSIRPIIALWVLGLTTYVLFNKEIPIRLEALTFALLSDIIKFYFIGRTTEKVINEILKLIKR